MHSEEPGLKRSKRTIFFITGLILVLLLSLPVSGDEQTRIPTEITIALDPVNPTSGQGFFINGNLSTEAGEPLGNKWVTLLSTQAGATPGPFGYLTVTKTALEGSFQFYRPPSSPPEDLKVIFKGLYGYNSSESNVVSAKK